MSNMTLIECDIIWSHEDSPRNLYIFVNAQVWFACHPRTVFAGKFLPFGLSRANLVIQNKMGFTSEAYDESNSSSYVRIQYSESISDMQDGRENPVFCQISQQVKSQIHDKKMTRADLSKNR